MISELKKNYSYCEKTGNFTRIFSPTKKENIGKVITQTDTKGYVYLLFSGKRYSAHRMAWLYFYGEIPDGIIDHANGDKTDNRIVNLRIADNYENNYNSFIRKDNKSGVKGVYFSKFHKKWHARIKVNKRNINLGYFDKLECAESAYKEAAIKHHGAFYKATKKRATT